VTGRFFGENQQRFPQAAAPGDDYAIAVRATFWRGSPPPTKIISAAQLTLVKRDKRVMRFNALQRASRNPLTAWFKGPAHSSGSQWPQFGRTLPVTAVA